MTITVRFFASLREGLGRGEAVIDSAGIRSAADVWRQCTPDPLPPNTLVAVNMEYALPEAPVRDGDEVAFFPPVTGGAM